MAGNREQLEIRALEIVQQGGLKGLSFRSLADDVGIKSSSVHYHFPEKSDLARALIKRYSEAFFQQMDKIEQSKSTLKTKIRAFVAIFEQVANDDKLCLCGMMAAELEQIDDITRAQLREYFSETENRLQKILDAHKAELSVKTEPKQLAKMMLSGLEGALLIDRVLGEKVRLKAQKDLFLSMIH